MSRIGKKPIEIPSGVEAILKEGSIEVKGALGSRHFDFSEKLKVDIVDKSITVTPKNLEKETRQLWGMSRSQIANIVGYAYILLESTYYPQEQPSNNTLLTVLFMALSIINIYLIAKPSTQCLFVKNMTRSIPSFLKTLGQIANRLQTLLKPEKPLLQTLKHDDLCGSAHDNS